MGGKRNPETKTGFQPAGHSNFSNALRHRDLRPIAILYCVLIFNGPGPDWNTRGAIRLPSQSGRKDLNQQPSTVAWAATERSAVVTKRVPPQSGRAAMHISY